jgi:hypothetical protein
MNISVNFCENSNLGYSGARRKLFHEKSLKLKVSCQNSFNKSLHSDVCFVKRSDIFRLETCPGGWEEFERYCYQVRPTVKHWIEAENDCTMTGAHLASIHSQAENDFINDLVNDLGPRTETSYPSWWLGGSDYASEVINSSMMKTTD